MRLCGEVLPPAIYMEHKIKVGIEGTQVGIEGTQVGIEGTQVGCRASGSAGRARTAAAPEHVENPLACSKVHLAGEAGTQQNAACSAGLAGEVRLLTTGTLSSWEGGGKVWLSCEEINL